MCRNGLEPLPRHGSPGAGGTASSTLWAQEPCDPAPASPLAKSTAVGRTPGSGGPWAALPVYSVMVLTERANAACTASFSSSHFYRHLPRGSEGVCCATRLLLSSPPHPPPRCPPRAGLGLLGAVGRRLRLQVTSRPGSFPHTHARPVSVLSCPRRADCNCPRHPAPTCCVLALL